VIPAAHPAFIMRTGFAAADEFRVDVRRAVEFASGLRQLYPDNLIEHPTDKEVTEYARAIIELGEGGLDIETPEIDIDDDDLDPNTPAPIDVIGLAYKLGESIMVTPDQFHLLVPLLNEKRANPINLWAHNAIFDFSHLKQRFTLEGVRPACSMLAFYLLWSNLTNFDLATAQSYMIDMPYYKNWRKLSPDLYNTIGNCRDTYSTLWVGRECLKQMRAMPVDMRPLFWGHMMPLIWLVESWYKKGVRVDLDEANKVQLTLILQLNQLQDVWTKLLPTVDWESPKQLVELFTSQGLPLVLRERVRKDKSRVRTPSVDDAALEAYIKRGSKTAQLVQLMRGLKHGLSFVSMHDETGWIHPQIKQHAQVGGRIQTSGDNLQNIPESLPMFPDIHPRRIIVGDTPQCVIVEGDWSQLQLRVYAWYAKAKRLLDMFASGDYIYGLLYEELFKEPFFKSGGHTKADKLDHIPPWKLLEAKTYPMGFVFGRKPTDTVGVKLYRDFHSQNPEISAFHTSLFLDVTRRGFYQSLWGRLRRFPNAKAVRNEVLSCPGQVAEVDILTKLVLNPLPKRLAAMEWEGVVPRILFPVHDSVKLSCHKDQAYQIANLLEEHMTTPIPEMDGFVIPCEVKWGKSWDAE